MDTTITLYDDGSADGTAEEVHRNYPEIRILRGDGSAFWARSMAIAEKHVLNNSSVEDDDYVVWMNDDVCIDPDALGKLVDVATTHRDAVLIGAVRDPDSEMVTYSGFKRSGLHPLRLRTITPTSEEQNIDTFNGNLVLVPVTVARYLGGIDGGYAHALADIDYGFRARHAGVEVLLAAGTHGTCRRNNELSPEGLLKRWDRYRNPKGGGHLGSMRRILRKENPRMWPLYILSTYFLWWARNLARELSPFR